MAALAMVDQGQQPFAPSGSEGLFCWPAWEALADAVLGEPDCGPCQTAARLAAARWPIPCPGA